MGARDIGAMADTPPQSNTPRGGKDACIGSETYGSRGPQYRRCSSGTDVLEVGGWHVLLEVSVTSCRRWSHW